MVVVEIVGKLGEQAALSNRAAVHFFARGAAVAVARFVVFFGNPVARYLGIQAAPAPVNGCAAIVAFVAAHACVHFEAHVLPVAQQVGGIHGFGDNRAAGCADAEPVPFCTPTTFTKLGSNKNRPLWWKICESE